LLHSCRFMPLCGCRALAFWCRRQTMTLQDVADRFIADRRSTALFSSSRWCAGRAAESGRPNPPWAAGGCGVMSAWRSAAPPRKRARPASVRPSTAVDRTREASVYRAPDCRTTRADAQADPQRGDATRREAAGGFHQVGRAGQGGIRIDRADMHEASVGAAGATAEPRRGDRTRSGGGRPTSLGQCRAALMWRPNRWGFGV
jgi:hypothetical protein